MNIPRFLHKKGKLYIDKETYNRDVMKVKEYKEEENEKLNNIIEELEKYLKEQIQKSWEIEEQCYENIYNYLQELKEE